MYYNFKLAGFLDMSCFDVVIDDAVAVILFIANFHNFIDCGHSFFLN